MALKFDLKFQVLPPSPSFQHLRTRAKRDTTTKRVLPLSLTFPEHVSKRNRDQFTNIRYEGTNHVLEGDLR